MSIGVLLEVDKLNPDIQGIRASNLEKLQQKIMEIIERRVLNLCLQIKAAVDTSGFNQKYLAYLIILLARKEAGVVKYERVELREFYKIGQTFFERQNDFEEVLDFMGHRYTNKSDNLAFDLVHDVPIVRNENPQIQEIPKIPKIRTSSIDSNSSLRSLTRIPVEHCTPSQSQRKIIRRGREDSIDIKMVKIEEKNQEIKKPILMSRNIYPSYDTIKGYRDNNFLVKQPLSSQNNRFYGSKIQEISELTKSKKVVIGSEQSFTQYQTAPSTQRIRKKSLMNANDLYEEGKNTAVDEIKSRKNNPLQTSYLAPSSRSKPQNERLLSQSLAFYASNDHTSKTERISLVSQIQKTAKKSKPKIETTNLKYSKEKIAAPSQQSQNLKMKPLQLVSPSNDSFNNNSKPLLSFPKHEESVGGNQNSYYVRNQKQDSKRQLRTKVKSYKYLTKPLDKYSRPPITGVSTIQEKLRLTHKQPKTEKSYNFIKPAPKVQLSSTNTGSKYSSSLRTSQKYISMTANPSKRNIYANPHSYSIFDKGIQTRRREKISMLTSRIQRQVGRPVDYQSTNNYSLSNNIV